MSAGNFGALEAFVAVADSTPGQAPRFESVGLLRGGGSRGPLRRPAVAGGMRPGGDRAALLPADATLALSRQRVRRRLRLGSEAAGLAGLGAKLVGDPYDDGDRELLTTLVNNLVVALKNARSYQQILGLNEELSAKNLQLQAALRKVEILESVKASLSKFVPATVCHLIGKSETGTLPRARNAT